MGGETVRVEISVWEAGLKDDEDQFREFPANRIALLIHPTTDFTTPQSNVVEGFSGQKNNATIVNICRRSVGTTRTEVKNM